MTECVRLRL